MESVLEQGIFYLIPTAFDLMGSVILLAGQFGVTIVIVVLLTGFAYVSVVGVCRKRQTELRVARTDRFDDKAAIKNESLSNVELLKYFCMEPYEVSRYAKASGRAQKANWDAEIYGYTVDLLKEAIKVSGEHKCAYRRCCASC